MDNGVQEIKCMAKLKLFLLGPPRLEREGVPLQFDTRKILALVAYVAVSSPGSEGERVRRDSLITLLWPELEPSRARAVLRRNLSLLRKALEGEWLLVDRQTVGTDPKADFWLDVDHFVRLVHAWETHGHPQEQVCPQCLANLEEAAALYQGDFLEGFGLRDSVEYDDWAFFQAEGLRQAFASALARLVHGHSAQGNAEAALPHARRWLALDPLHEPAHRQLMQLYARTGQRSAALRQYAECVRILDEELGLRPAEETTALYEQIRTTPPGVVEGMELPVRATPRRHNLPAQATPFIGREEELAEMSTLLQDPACRLLTLLGPGGIGKTRLALRLAEDLVEAEPTSFEHGVFLVSLARFQAAAGGPGVAEGVVPAVAEALGYSFHTDVEGSTRAAPRQQLLDYLRHKQLLLVMDNYEHLLVDGTSASGQNGRDGAGFVTDVLSAAPGVKVLATSRVSLKVQGEHLYSVEGLRVPEATPTAPADARQVIRGYSAVELFVQAAQQARPDFELRSRDMVHVIQICRLVQGMPLGILLAAAWVDMLSPEAIAAEIQQSLDFLETDLRDVPARQRSIRAVFDHSWRLLDERERELFQGLSVFRGGFTRAAAQEVVGASLRDLMSLANKSLLHPCPAGRYELHELLRQYAADRLDLAPEQGEAVRDRHRAYYCATLERWARELKGARQKEARDEMDPEMENAWAAWCWAVAHGQIACLARSVDGLWLYHVWRMRYEEAEAAFGAAARELEAIDSPAGQRLRAKLLVLRSHFEVEQGKKQAVETAEQGLALLQTLEQAGHDVRPETALAMVERARMKYYDHEPLEARQQYARGVALYEEVGDRWGLARALGYLGLMDEHLGEYEQAQELCERSLIMRRELGDQRGMADAMITRGVISWVQGRLEEADCLFQESLGIYWAMDDWSRVAQAIKSVGEVLVRRGRFDEGLALMESSVDLYEDLGHRYGRLGLLAFLGESKVHLGRYAEARADAQQGAALSRQAKHRWGVGFAQFVDGLGALVGDPPLQGAAEGPGREALALFQEAMAVFEEVRHRENRGWVLGPLGLAARETGETALAREWVIEALKTGVELGAFMPVMYGLPAAALLLAAQGAVERAVEAYACASRYGFVANSCWFKEVAGKPIAAAASVLPAELIEAARAKGQGQAWKAMAAALLTDLENPGE
jgi:DNA-binding SARP family transcriptional activator/predicted ATPase